MTNNIAVQSGIAGMFAWAPPVLSRFSGIAYAANGAIAMLSKVAFNAAGAAITRAEEELRLSPIAEVAQRVDANQSIAQASASVLASGQTAAYVKTAAEKVKSYSGEAITWTSRIGGALALSRRALFLADVGQESNPAAMFAAKAVSAVWMGYQASRYCDNFLKMVQLGSAPQKQNLVQKCVGALRKNFLPIELACRGLETSSFLFKTVGIGMLLSGVTAGLYAAATTTPEQFHAGYQKAQKNEESRAQADKEAMHLPS